MACARPFQGKVKRVWRSKVVPRPTRRCLALLQVIPLRMKTNKGRTLPPTKNTGRREEILLIILPHGDETVSAQLSRTLVVGEMILYTWYAIIARKKQAKTSPRTLSIFSLIFSTLPPAVTLTAWYNIGKKTFDTPRFNSSLHLHSDTYIQPTLAKNILPSPECETPNEV